MFLCDIIILLCLAVAEGERFTRLRNGVNTGTQNYQSGRDGETYAQFTTRRSNNVQVARGLHESFDYYDDCYFRERNQGVCSVWRERERGIKREK